MQCIYYPCFALCHTYSRPKETYTATKEEISLGVNVKSDYTLRTIVFTTKVMHCAALCLQEPFAHTQNVAP